VFVLWYNETAKKGEPLQAAPSFATTCRGRDTVVAAWLMGRKADV